ncbi:MAG: purine-nucleoside phosphorylase [Lachnospiraceae bacterium]|jgi:purine-nucleoside phosphorylase|nr:purine-nucleoside phosphorylase [Lachnospiraceae bacterium]
MATPHIGAVKGQIADVVLMPGDPLRAKMIAEEWMDNAELVSSVRGMYAYSCTYRGRKITVMASGMGMPSMGIYSYELFSEYGVEAIIRCGSSGSFVPSLNVGDVVYARDAWTDSSFAKVQCGEENYVLQASHLLNVKLNQSAWQNGIEIIPTRVYSSDVFYKAPTSNSDALAIQNGCTCIEMEAFALFHNAKMLGKQAGCLLTISDSFVTGEAMTAEERQSSFGDMIIVAMGAAASL